MATSFLNRMDLPLGLRNNNPGNLRPGIAWQGATGENGGFLVFQDIVMGLRALATDIGNDIRLDGTNTLRGLVYEFAPPSENNTAGYLSRMQTLTGFSESQPIPRTGAALAKLMRGFVTVEVGDGYAGLVTDADILAGLGLMNEDLRDFFSITQMSGGSGAGNDAGVWLGMAAVAGLALFYFNKK